MAKRRRTHRRTSGKLPIKVTFRKGGRHVVVFRHHVATAATKAKRRAAGKRLAKMWTKAERMANLRKAWAKNRRRSRR
jgi:hypothetical protein